MYTPKKWLTSWFHFSCRLIDYFWLTHAGRYFSSREERYAEGTNLCHFVRTMGFGILISFIVISMYLYVAFVALVLPFMAFSAYNILYIFEIIGLIIVVVIVGMAIVVGGFFGIRWIYRQIMWSLPDKIVETETKQPGLCRVLYDYYAAVKQRICPIIIFETEPKLQEEQSIPDAEEPVSETPDSVSSEQPETTEKTND